MGYTIKRCSGAQGMRSADHLRWVAPQCVLDGYWDGLVRQNRCGRMADRIARTMMSKTWNAIS